MSETFWLILVLIFSVFIIIAGTAKFKIHPFIVLLFVSYFAGGLSGLPVSDLSKIIAGGFGGIMTGIGLVIIFGTLIGVVLEKSGAAIKLAELVLKVIGPRYPALAMAIIGYIVSIPVFCDSGFVILSSVKKSVALKTKKSPIVLSIALATGLYATHTFVPPTPGPVAAAGNLGLENQLGKVIIFGLIFAFAAMLAGYGWSLISGKKSECKSFDTNPGTEPIQKLPGSFNSVLPVFLPVFLIAIRSVSTMPSGILGNGIFFTIVDFCGQPVNALFIGVLAALPLLPGFNQKTLTGWVADGISAAAPILLITGAGGAFGAVLKETKIGETLGNLLAEGNLGIFLPFLIAAVFKSAQGSTTVALVATSALVAPMLQNLGLDSETGRILTVMATGAGAMTVSHVNDSFFWVVTQFSGIDVKTGLKTLTLATLWQGLISMIFIYFTSLFLL